MGCALGHVLLLLLLLFKEHVQGRPSLGVSLLVSVLQGGHNFLSCPCCLWSAPPASGSSGHRLVSLAAENHAGGYSQAIMGWVVENRNRKHMHFRGFMFRVFNLLLTETTGPSAGAGAEGGTGRETGWRIHGSPTPGLGIPGWSLLLLSSLRYQAPQ